VPSGTEQAQRRVGDDRAARHHPTGLTERVRLDRRYVVWRRGGRVRRVVWGQGALGVRFLTADDLDVLAGIPVHGHDRDRDQNEHHGRRGEDRRDDERPVPRRHCQQAGRIGRDGLRRLPQTTT